MGSIITNCITAVRNLPQTSAIDFGWIVMGHYQLTESSVLSPQVDFSVNKIVQTTSRLFFAIILPSVAKYFGFANLGLGGVHLVWCICNIGKIKNNEEGLSSKELENALTRICTGVYDLVIGYLLCSSFMSSLYGRPTIPLVFALFPNYAIQLHHWIFEKATRTVAEGASRQEIDHLNLKVGCLIKQFCSGLVETFWPKPEAPTGFIARAYTLPSAMGEFGKNVYSTLRGAPKQTAAPQPVENT